MTADSKKTRDTLIENRRAFRDNEVLERFEAGVELKGTEVKSVRAGKVDLTGGFAVTSGSQLYLRDVHISPYEHGGHYNHEPTRPRRLLMHRHEIRSLTDRAAQKGLIILPLKIYMKRGWAKVELGLCRGRKARDKRDVLKKKTADREAAHAVRAAR